MHLTCGEAEIAYLKGRDAALAKVMDALGPLQRAAMPDLFEALVHAIVGQQISTKAQQSIFARMRTALGAPLTPSALGALDEASLQSFGLSFRKVRYIKAAAAAVISGALDLDALRQLDDAAFCAQLVQLDGVGLWTAEMLLIFCLQRPDVMSFGDLAVLRGLRMLYRHKRITPALFAKYRKRYAPYASVASLYLWAVAGGALEELTDPAAKARPAKKQPAKKQADKKRSLD